MPIITTTTVAQHAMTQAQTTVVRCSSCNARMGNAAEYPDPTDRQCKECAK